MVLAMSGVIRQEFSQETLSWVKIIGESSQSWIITKFIFNGTYINAIYVKCFC